MTFNRGKVILVSKNNLDDILSHNESNSQFYTSLVRISSIPGSIEDGEKMLCKIKAEDVPMFLNDELTVYYAPKNIPEKDLLCYIKENFETMEMIRKSTDEVFDAIRRLWKPELRCQILPNNTTAFELNLLGNDLSQKELVDNILFKLTNIHYIMPQEAT